MRQWAGNTIYNRGKNYVDNVFEISTTDNGTLAAWVSGTEEYATSVRRNSKGNFTYTCSCPYDSGPCKHAVAVLLNAVDMLKTEKQIPLLEPEDELFMELFVYPEDNEEYDDGFYPSTRYPGVQSLLVNKTREELVGIIENLAKLFPEVHRNLCESAQLDNGEIKSIEKNLLAEINALTTMDTWYDPWNDKGDLPDFSHLEEQLNALLKKGHADAVVRLGTVLWKEGYKQIEQSGAVEELAEEISYCMDVVMESLPRTSMSPPNQILWYIERNLTDDYGLLPQPSDFEKASQYNKNHWNDVAASLEKRLDSMEISDTPSFSERYSRDNIVSWLKTAYEKSGQKEKLLPLMEKEADYCREYMPLINEFIKKKNYKKAREWCIHGYNETIKDAPGIACQMREQLCLLAAKEKKLDLAAAYFACEFFCGPSESSYKKLRDASEKINQWPKVRHGVLDYLQTGLHPASAKEETWPLPQVEIEQPPEKEYRKGRFPDIQMQIRIAILEKRNNDAVKLYGTLVEQSKFTGGIEEDIAEAVKRTHPDFTLKIWESAARKLIATVKPKAYYEAAGYLRRMRDIYRKTKRMEEWKILVNRLQIEHKAKRRFMEILKDLEDGEKALL